MIVIVIVIVIVMQCDAMRCDAMRLWEHTVLQQAVRRLLCSMFRTMELQINNGTSEAKLDTVVVLCLRVQQYINYISFLCFLCVAASCY